MKTSPRILALVLLGSLLAPLWASAQTAGTVPQFGHVVIVLGENAGFSQTYQSGAMPYLDSLAAKYGLATNYVADTHGSLYDYLMLTSGQTLADSPTATPSEECFRPITSRWTSRTLARRGGITSRTSTAVAGG